MDIDGKEIQPENYDIRLSNVHFPMTNGRSLTIYRSLSHRKRRQQLLDRLVEENQHFAI